MIDTKEKIKILKSIDWSSDIALQEAAFPRIDLFSVHYRIYILF